MIYFQYQIIGGIIMNMQKIGKYLVKLRKGKGWTQRQLAEQLSVSPQAVSKWECGETVPDIDILNKISMIYAVPIDCIIKTQDSENFVFEFGIGILPYMDMTKVDNLIQQVAKYHEIAEFPKIHFKDNTELREMQYRIIIDGAVMADNDLEYVEEKNRINEMLSYINLYIK